MSKISDLTATWRRGTIKTSRQLAGEGYDPQLLRAYSKSGWIELLSYGAYKLRGDHVEWPGGLFALQQTPECQIHAGGRTALELQGFAHYLRSGAGSVEIFGRIEDRLPAWFNTSFPSPQINFHKTNSLDYSVDGSFRDYDVANVPLKISDPELGIMEMAYLIPKKHSLEETNLIMESLTTIRPLLLQRLLESCKSVKVNRIVLYLAELNKHRWFNQLDISKIRLGSGKREIVKNGKLDKKYGITVMKESNR